MTRIKSNYHALHVLKNASPRLRKAILKNADKGLILSIVECALNILNGNCKIGKCTKRKLGKFRKVLRELCKKASISKKRKLIIQKGGFLLPLLSAVLPSLISLITGK
mgnify:CR=1 FL=1